MCGAICRQMKGRDVEHVLVTSPNCRSDPAVEFPLRTLKLCCELKLEVKFQNVQVKG